MADLGAGEGSDGGRKPARRGRGRGGGARTQRLKTGPRAEGEGGGEEGSPSSHAGGDRRPLRFWQPFNDWWRADLERLGRRPNAQEILAWFNENALTIWKQDTPTLQETRVHAKCLRSLPLVRDYFRNYRAKKRAVAGDDEFDGEEGDMRGGDSTMLNDDVSARFAALQQHAFQQAAYRLDYGGAGAGGIAEFMQSGLHPGLQAHALWGAHTASLDPQQQDLLRNLTLTQLQHAAAMQQQLTLAAIANQLASRHSIMQSVTSPTDLDAEQQQQQQQQVVPPPLPLQLHEAQTLPSLPLLNLQQALPLHLPASLMLGAPAHQPSVEVSSTGAGGGAPAGGTEAGALGDDGRNVLSLMLQQASNEEAAKHTDAGNCSVSTNDGALQQVKVEAALGDNAAGEPAQSANMPSAAVALPSQTVVGVPAMAPTAVAPGEPLPAVAPAAELAADREASSSHQHSAPVVPGQAPERGALLERPHDELVQQVLELERKLQAQAEANAARDAELAAAQQALREAELRLMTKTDEQQVLSALTELGQHPVVGTGSNRQVGHLLLSSGVAKRTSSTSDSLPRKRHQSAAVSGGADAATSAPTAE